MKKFLSVCSGIEAASCAWDWEAVAFSEIEKFPCQVLAHHYPKTPNWGDMTKFKEWPDANVDVLVGGTPCQSFSVAGLRKGLDDPRGNLMLTYLAIAAKYRPKWVVWENVPGVLSSNGGLDFASFLRGLGECGYGFAYRVLDAQYFGVPQRRRRVFVVGCLGDWRSAAAVLFEQHSLQGHLAPSRKTGKDLAKCLTTSTQRYDTETETLVTQPIAYNITFCDANGTRADRPNGGLYVNETDVTSTLTKAGIGTNIAQPITFSGQMSNPQTDVNLSGTLQAKNPMAVAKPMPQSMAVRRLTPVECERLQGFPDGYTDIQLKGKPTPDGPRYKALGNSMAVPVMRWIGQRIEAVDRIK
jgi:DNA (cytosine-5)-methyltransferase 1